MSSHGPASPSSKPAIDNPYFHLPEPLLIKYGSIYLGIMGGVALLWYACHLIRNCGRWKVRVPNGPQYIRTWHGWIKHSRYQRHAERKRRFRGKFRGRFNWKTTTADYKWIFFDPTGMKKREYHLRREQTFLRYLPQWMRSWEPQFVPADKFRDLEQGADSAHMSRIDLPPRYSQISRNVPIISQVDGSRSCVEVTPNYPFMSGALPDCCDCPVAHTVRRRKNIDPSRVVWHANGEESSRAICNQLLMSRKTTHLSMIKAVQSEADVPPETLLNTAEQVAQRAISLPCRDMSTPVNKKQIRHSVSTSIDALGKMRSDLDGLNQTQGPGHSRYRPYNKEISISHRRAESRKTAIIEALKQPSAPKATNQNTVITDYCERRRRENYGSKRRALNPTTSRADTDGPLSRVSKHQRDTQIEAIMDAPKFVQGDLHVSVSSFEGVLARILRYSSENKSPQRMRERRYALQLNGYRRQSQLRYPEPIEIEGATQTDGSDDPKSLQKIPNGKPQREEHFHPGSLRVVALTDSAIEGSLELMFSPNRFKVLSTMGSPRSVSELTLEKKENIPLRISQVPVQQRTLCFPKQRPLLRQYSGNADTHRKRSLGLPDKITPAPSREHRVTLSTIKASKRTLPSRIPSFPKRASLRDVCERLEWFQWELMPGFRKTIHEIPYLLDLADPQPIGMCGGTSERIHRRTGKETRPQSRYHKPLNEVEFDIIPADTAIVTDAWIAPQPPHGLPHATINQKPLLYSRGSDTLWALDDWQQLNGQKQPESLNPVKDEDRYQRPKRRKRSKPNNHSVSGLVVKKLRRIGKLNVRRYRQIASHEAKPFCEDQSTSDFADEKRNTSHCEHKERDIGVEEIPESAEQPEGEVGDNQSPESDASTLLGTEEPSGSPTLVNDEERLDALVSKDFKDHSELSVSPWQSMAYKIDPRLFDEHPLSRFHNSYSQRPPSYQEHYSQLSVQRTHQSSLDVGVGD